MDIAFPSTFVLRNVGFKISKSKARDDMPRGVFMELLFESKSGMKYGLFLLHIRAPPVVCCYLECFRMTLREGVLLKARNALLILFG